MMHILYWVVGIWLCGVWLLIIKEIVTNTAKCWPELNKREKLLSPILPCILLAYGIAAVVMGGIVRVALIIIAFIAMGALAWHSSRR